MHGKFGLLSLGKASSHSTALPSCCFFLCAVFSCFRNPPNSDMDYRIFTVRTFLCMRTHTGVGHTDNESAQHFSTLTYFSCALDGIRPSRHGIHWISRPTLHQLSHHVHICGTEEAKSTFGGDGDGGHSVYQFPQSLAGAKTSIQLRVEGAHACPNPTLLVLVLLLLLYTVVTV